jgi:dephospho-CoA kinase
VVARNGLTPQEVDRIMAQQATREQRLACADLVIFNQGLSLEELRQQVLEAAVHFGL